MLKLKDLGTIFVLSIVGLVFATLSFITKYFIENGVLYGVVTFILLLWMIRFAIQFFG
nr:MAG TPA: hypothetical protein [Caudoviricetes sp.]